MLNFIKIRDWVSFFSKFLCLWSNWIIFITVLILSNFFRIFLTFMCFKIHIIWVNWIVYHKLQYFSLSPKVMALGLISLPNGEDMFGSHWSIRFPLKMRQHNGYECELLYCVAKRQTQAVSLSKLFSLTLPQFLRL